MKTILSTAAGVVLGIILIVPILLLLRSIVPFTIRVLFKITIFVLGLTHGKTIKESFQLAKKEEIGN